jgi:hypothetical protein
MSKQTIYKRLHAGTPPVQFRQENTYKRKRKKERKKEKERQEYIKRDGFVREG